MNPVAWCLAVQDAVVEPGSLLGTTEIVFLSLWLVFGLAYWAYYRESENVAAAFAKVAGLLLFVYAVIRMFDWFAHPVAPEAAILMPWQSEPTEVGPRIPFLSNAFQWFVGGLIALVIWYARRKFGTVVGVILSAWDRGHWYMLPVLFILLTVGLLLVAAAASPVLSPFIYTLF